MAKHKSSITECIVYWLYDRTCKNPTKHGYVGVTAKLQQRIDDHKKSQRFPRFRVRVLFRGSRADCLRKEAEYRPKPSIGWNLKTGGMGGRGQYPLSSRIKMAQAKMGNQNGKGWEPTEEQRAKLAIAMAARSPEVKKRVGQNSKGTRYSAEVRATMGHRVGIRHSEVTKARIGAANSISLLGKKHTEQTKAKMKQSGKAAWTKERREWMRQYMQNVWQTRRQSNVHNTENRCNHWTGTRV